MTTPKFTPGPWLVISEAIKGRLGISAATGEHITWAMTGGLQANGDANARLIAAAPCLYGMVRDLLEFLEPMRFDRRSDDDRAIVLDTEMRTLLAKIDGGDHA